LTGDGVVDIGGKTLGFSAKYAEVAEAVLHMLATWARAYGAGIMAEEHTAVFVAPRTLLGCLRPSSRAKCRSTRRLWRGRGVGWPAHMRLS